MSNSMFDSLYTPQAVNPNPYTYTAGDSMQTAAMGNFSNNQFDMSAGKNSTFGAGGGFDTTVGNIGKVAGVASTLGSLYVGLKSLGIAEDELDIKKDQWAMSKAELQHMQATRKRLTSSYMGNKPSPQGQAQAKPQTKGASALAGRY